MQKTSNWTISFGCRFKRLHLQRGQHMQAVSGCAPKLCVVLPRGGFLFHFISFRQWAFCQAVWCRVVQIFSSASYNMLGRNVCRCRSKTLYMKNICKRHNFLKLKCFALDLCTSTCLRVIFQAVSVTLIGLLMWVLVCLSQWLNSSECVVIQSYFLNRANDP